MAAKFCNVCNIRRVYTGSKGTEVAPEASDMCNYCWEEGGMENQHSDHAHNAIREIVEHAGDAQLSESDKTELAFMATCWICHPELNLAQKPVATRTGTRVQGTRRPQLNHQGHSHPQTPAARRACKALFWKQTTMHVGTPEQLAQAMQQWNATLDGKGKPVQASTWAGVAPRGPRGGVVKQTQRAVSAERKLAKAAGLVK